jgi:glycerate 2-kinase
VRVLFCPEPYAVAQVEAPQWGLSASLVTTAMTRGWARSAPADDLVRAPLSDGGSGFVEVLHEALGGEVVPVTATGPFGAELPAAILLAGQVAYVEVAEVSGLHLVAASDRDPGRATSYGAGELIRAAVDTGAHRVVVGVGGTASNDGGAGLLAALDAGPREALDRGGLALAGVQAGDLDRLAAVRDSLTGVELVLASAIDAPLLGFHGTSASYAEGKGATATQAQQLESALGHYADLASRALVAGRSLLGRGAAGEPGAGAGGGIGFALMLLGARRVDGVRAVAEAIGLAGLVASSDLVVTGEGSFDWESLRGGVVAEAAALGLDAGVPVIVLAGEVLVGRRESMTLGLAGTYAVAERPGDLPAVLTDPLTAIENRAARVARTWSRPQD